MLALLILTTLAAAPSVPTPWPEPWVVMPYGAGEVIIAPASGALLAPGEAEADVHYDPDTPYLRFSRALREDRLPDYGRALLGVEVTLLDARMQPRCRARVADLAVRSYVALDSVRGLELRAAYDWDYRLGLQDPPRPPSEAATARAFARNHPQLVALLDAEPGCTGVFASTSPTGARGWVPVASTDTTIVARVFAEPAYVRLQQMFAAAVSAERDRGARASASLMAQARRMRGDAQLQSMFPNPRETFAWQVAYGSVVLEAALDGTLPATWDAGVAPELSTFASTDNPGARIVIVALGNRFDCRFPRAWFGFRVDAPTRLWSWGIGAPPDAVVDLAGDGHPEAAWLTDGVRRLVRPRLTPTAALPHPRSPSGPEPALGRARAVPDAGCAWNPEEAPRIGNPSLRNILYPPTY